MSVVVGFNWPIEHDNSAAAIVDGKLVFATEEERYTRHKHSLGEFPINALARLYKHLDTNFGIKSSDITTYAVNFNPSLWPIMYKAGTLRSTAFHHVFNGLPTTTYVKEIMGSTFRGFDTSGFAKHMIKIAIREYGGKAPPDSEIRIETVRHHLSHAASAYYFSGYNSAAVLTADGWGEQESTTVWHVKNGEFEPILSVPAIYGSIGSFYEAIAMQIGFNYTEGPGKVMGLAPYGKPSPAIEKVFERHVRMPGKSGKSPYYFLLEGETDKNKDFSGRYQRGKDLENFYVGLAQQIVGDRIKWNPKEEVNQKAADISWVLQNYTEKLMVSLAEWAKSNTNEKSLALAGGVALNAKANMQIHYSNIFDDVFVFHGANDGGSPIGAAAYVYEHVLGQKMKREKITTAYWGPDYDDDQVKKIVTGSKFKSEFVGNDTSDVAKMISKGRVVCWYQGRAEFGPRALGNRSIVADPRDKEMWSKINKIKGREFWRPIAPSLLEKDSSKYFVDPKPHQFMIMMYKMKDGMKKRVPTVCHVDNTARPQTVTSSQNKNWNGLIENFKEITGEGIIVNTSFNLAGEPVVETPQDAIRSFALGGFDAIYLQGWLLKKY